MPALGFMIMLAGGISVWAGYTGYSIGKVTKAILKGETSTLTRIPLDPDLRPKAPVAPSTPAPIPPRPSNLPQGATLDQDRKGYTWIDPFNFVTYHYDLNGNPVGLWRQ